MSMAFYSYLWLRADGTPYYAGKGTGRRAFQSSGHGAIHIPKDRTRILVFPMLTEAEAFESEIALIDLFGRKDLGTGCLRNKTNGGDCPPSRLGLAHSEETKRRMHETHSTRKRQPHSLRTRQKLAEAGYRRRHPDDVKARISEGNRRRWAKVSLEDRQKQGAIMRGER
jgi:hypothetical protein